MHRVWLVVALCSAATAFGQTGIRSDIPFNAIVYGVFVMPYPEFGRQYDTSTFAQAASLMKLKASPRSPRDLQPLGAWVTKDATHDPFHIYGEDQDVSGAIFIFSRDIPGPSSPSKNTAALAINIQRPKLTQMQFKLVQEGQKKISKSGNFNKNFHKGSIIYSFCTKNGGQDYPAFNAQIKLSCTAELRKRDISIIVKSINLSEKRAIDELIKIDLLVD